MNASELMMDALSNADPDEMASAIIIWRRNTGTIGYTVTDDQDSAATMGMLKFVSMSVEHELKKSWSEEL